MDQYEYARTAHRVYGKAISEIARETGHDRKAVRKALRQLELTRFHGYPKADEGALHDAQDTPPYSTAFRQQMEADGEKEHLAMKRENG